VAAGFCSALSDIQKPVDISGILLVESEGLGRFGVFWALMTPMSFLALPMAAKISGVMATPSTSMGCRPTNGVAVLADSVSGLPQFKAGVIGQQRYRIAILIKITLQVIVVYVPFHKDKDDRDSRVFRVINLARKLNPELEIEVVAGEAVARAGDSPASIPLVLDGGHVVDDVIGCHEAVFFYLVLVVRQKGFDRQKQKEE
jgi:hypothetical protein